jgi:signal transduction histidine kinase/Tfp pilus assembly protein PilF
MLPKPSLPIFLFGIFTMSVVAQNDRIDSLQRVAQSGESDSVRIAAQSQLAFHYIFNDSKAAWNYLMDAEALLSQTTLPYSTTNIIYVKAVYYDVTGQADSSRFYFEKGYDQSRQFGFPDLEVKFLNGLGMNSWNRGYYQTALDFFLQVLSVNEGLPEDKRIPWSTPYNNIGLIYQELGLYDQALTYHKQALDYRLSDPKLIAQVATSYNNMGICYYHLKQFTEAERAYRSGIEVAKSNNFLRQYYDLLANLANTLVSLHRYREALALNLEVLEPDQKIVLPEKFRMNIHAAAAGVYLQLREPGQAIKHLDAGFQLIENKPDLEFFATDLYRYASATWYMLGDTEKGKAYADRLADILEDRFSKRNAQSMAEMEIKYETAQKEMQLVDQQLKIEQQNVEVARQRNRTIMLMAALVVLILLFIIFYRTYTARQRARMQQAIIDEKERGLEAVFQATEEERQRISKDLHDGIGQQLSGVKMQLETLATEVAEPNLQQKAKTITLNLKQAADEVRVLSHQMMPRSLTELGLVPALQDLLEKTFGGTTIRCAFEHHAMEHRPEAKIELVVYRVVQELISNIIRHAHAHQVTLQLFQTASRLVLTAEDDGIGMQVGSDSFGHGLINMQNRLHAVKGTIQFEANDPSGTLVTVSIPLN